MSRAWVFGVINLNPQARRACSDGSALGAVDVSEPQYSVPGFEVCLRHGTLKYLTFSHVCTYTYPQGPSTQVSGPRNHRGYGFGTRVLLNIGYSDPGDMHILIYRASPFPIVTLDFNLEGTYKRQVVGPRRRCSTKIHADIHIYMYFRMVAHMYMRLYMYIYCLPNKHGR